jgi:asparagine synthase (glutamine-hydrolysing)
MPGLAVIITSAEKESSEANVHKMVAAMLHEPFYTSGTYCNGVVGCYVGWVCHAGSFSDCMPLRSKDGNLLVFFYGEHRSDADSGQHSNGRRVLELIEAHRLNALPLLNGWFQGVIIDLKQREVAVFNDRYGMQRLHQVAEDGTTIFASEVNALLTVRPKLRVLDARSLGEFLSCGCVLENRSLFSNITTLPAAAVRVYKDAVPLKNYTYFSPSEWENQSALSDAEYRAALLVSFPRAVRRCFNSDIPIGISLTGGFDTRMIMAWLPEGNRKTPPSYTFGGMYRDCFDVTIARKVAAISGCNHHVIELGDNFLKSFPALAEKTILLSDGCLGATNAYELYLNQMAREVAVVRLTGSYGSEVMRGARAFKAVCLTDSIIHKDFECHINDASSTFNAASTGHPVSFSVFKQAPWYYYNRLAVEQSQVVVRTPYMDNDFVGLVYRRPEESMESRKLARYLISKGVPELAALRTDTGNCSYFRHVWSQFLFKADYCYKSGMPQWMEQIHHMCGPLQPEKLLIGRHRFAHFRVWFRNQLAPYIREILLDRRTAERPYFNHRRLELMLTQHINGERNYTDDIERALTVELTHRQFIDRKT